MFLAAMARRKEKFNFSIVFILFIVIGIALSVFLATRGSEFLSHAQLTTTDPSLLPKKPNILFILTDDQDVSSLAYMPKLKALMADLGTTFTNYFISNSLCCPSRTTILRGQYSHSTQIMSNLYPDGGFLKFYQKGEEQSTVATWLKASGYNTALFGKYLNGYADSNVGDTYIPPGWSEWYGAIDTNAYSEYNYTLNENGNLVSYGNRPKDYLTDVIAYKSNDFIKRSVASGKPFFAYISTFAPHNPATPAPRHQGLFPDLQAPRYPSYDEQDDSDKPTGMQRPLLNAVQMTKIDIDYRKKVRSLQAIDEMVGVLFNTLKNLNQLDNTYIIYSADNGYHFGLHRLTQGKMTAYEEDLHVPFYIRGPFIPAGKSIDTMVGNVDLAPTFAQLAHVPTPNFIEGASILPFILSSRTAPIRYSYLLEHVYPRNYTSDADIAPDAQDPQNDIVNGNINGNLNQGVIPDYSAIRTIKDQTTADGYVYVEYTNGEKEMYDIDKDPFELNNIVSTADPQLITRLANKLHDLQKCSGQSCLTLEKTPF